MLQTFTRKSWHFLTSPAQIHGEHVLGEFSLVPQVNKHSRPSIRRHAREGHTKDPIPGHGTHEHCLCFSEAKELVLHIEITYLKKIRYHIIY